MRRTYREHEQHPGCGTFVHPRYGAVDDMIVICFRMLTLDDHDSDLFENGEEKQLKKRRRLSC